MKEIIKLDVTRTLVNPKEFEKYEEGLKSGHKKLWSDKEEFTGWVRYPLSYDKDEISKIIDTAKKIRGQCQVFIVIGIGGSYLGSRAAINTIDPAHFGFDNINEPIPEIYFAGQNVSGTYHTELIEKIKDKDICLCIISKSGNTTESLIAFSILKNFLHNKYGKEESSRRIYAVTDASNGKLREEVDREGYTCFTLPSDIGGRFSVLTPVGLLPIAVAGINIIEMLDGAKSIAFESELKPQSNLQTESQKHLNIAQSIAWQYAALRVSLLSKGKVVEIFEYYEPGLEFFAEWLKQLFGESEGKNGKGIFPAALQFSTDLHSIGQFLQEGNQIFFETVLNVIKPDKDIIIPEGTCELFSGKGMNEINKAVMSGVMNAHNAAGIPIIKLDIPELSAYYFGQMVYFFETACALSAYLLEVNPFDQPGVESYKAEMKRALQK